MFSYGHKQSFQKHAFRLSALVVSTAFRDYRAIPCKALCAQRGVRGLIVSAIVAAFWNHKSLDMAFL